MKKRIISIVISVVVLIMILSSCADKEGNNTLTPEATGTAASTEVITTDKTPDGTPHSHAYGEWKKVSDPTCEKEGIKERECLCGEKEQEKIAVISHDYVDGVCSMCKAKDPDVFVSDYKKGQENKVGGEMSTGTYTSQANWIYFSPTSYSISKITKLGTNLTSVYEVSSGRILNLNIVGDWIYFYCEGNTVGKSYIAKVRTDGSGFVKILSGIRINDMLVVKDKIYYTIHNDSYNDYSKDCYPLYYISVNGGVTKMVNDGAVLSLRSDGNYVYYVHQKVDGTASICRIKADGTSKSTLINFKNGEEANFIAVSDSKIYFEQFDKYSEECIIASISINGGSYTTYGRIPFYSEFLYVKGSKVYYYGSPYVANGFSEDIGLIEYDLNTKKYKIVRSDFENEMYYFTNGFLIAETITNETLTKLYVYDTATGSVKTFKVK